MERATNRDRRMTNEEKLAEEYYYETYTVTSNFEEEAIRKKNIMSAFLTGLKTGKQEGAEFGYNKANEWHRVSDKLPAMDAFVYLWKKGKDFPVVARRHLPYGQKEWVWDCMWGSGFTISQLKGKDYLWKDMVLPKVAVKFDVPHSKAEQELNLENNLTDLGIM